MSRGFPNSVSRHPGRQPMTFGNSQVAKIGIVLLMFFMDHKCVFQLATLIMAQALVMVAQAQSPPANIAKTNTPIILPEITVIGHPVPDSITSPSAEKAARQNKEIPGGFTIKRRMK
jgi:ABC-type enterochelin transport system permease subunit